MSTETTEIDKNLWQAFISEPYGFCYTDPDEIAEQLADENAEATEISIRRRSALPTNKDGGLRHPGTYTSADIFVEIDLEDIDEPEDRVAAWELAKKAAWGMNQPAEQRVCGVTRPVRPGSDAFYICILDPGHGGDHSSCPGDEESSWPAAVPAVTADGSDQEAAKEN